MTDSPFANFYVRIDPTWPYRYLWDHPLGEQVNFTYVSFGEGFQDASQPTYADTDVIGRGELYKHFMGTSNKELSFTANFRVQNNGTSALRDEVIYPARWLDKCKHPVYDNRSALSYAPPPLLLRIGDLFHLRCIITSASIRWVEPFEPGTLLPHGADVDLTFTVVRRLNLDLGYRSESITTGTWR